MGDPILGPPTATTGTHSPLVADQMTSRIAGAARVHGTAGRTFEPAALKTVPASTTAGRRTKKAAPKEVALKTAVPEAGLVAAVTSTSRCHRPGVAQN